MCRKLSDDPDHGLLEGRHNRSRPQRFHGQHVVRYGRVDRDTLEFIMTLTGPKTYAM
jgi:hypothetical protein